MALVVELRVMHLAAVKLLLVVMCCLLRVVVVMVLIATPDRLLALALA